MINKTTKLVSVIMPVYNAGDFLTGAIESVLQQTYTDFELIMVDDASTDSSFKIMQKYCLRDKRIKIFQNMKNLGVARTLNKAISCSGGVYLARMDADDLMNPTRLETQVAYLENHPEVVAVGSNTTEIDQNGKITGQRSLPQDHIKIYEMMYYAMGMQHPTIMFNKNLIPKDFSWYRPVWSVEDLDLLFRLVKFGQFANIPRFLMKYRVHPNNLSLKNIKATFIKAQEIRKKAVRSYGYVPTLKSKIFNVLGSLVVFLLPDKLILALYSLLRNYEKTGLAK